MPIPTAQRPDTAPGSITTKQQRAIHVGKRLLQLDDATYREWLGVYLVEPIYRNWLANNGGQFTSSALSRLDARRLLTRMDTHGAGIGKPYTRRSMARASKGKKSPSAVVQLASPAELALIERLKADIPWRLADGYGRWLKRYHHIDAVRTADQADQVIEGLKGMLAHGSR